MEGALEQRSRKATDAEAIVECVYTGAAPQGTLFTAGWYLPKARDETG